MSDPQSAKLIELKAIIFDLREFLDEKTRFESEFFGRLAALLEVPADQATDPNSYLRAIVALKEKLETESSEGEKA